MGRSAVSAPGTGPGPAARLANVADWVERVIMQITNMLLLALVIVVFVQVVARYVFKIATIWSQEAAMFCFLWSVMLAGAVAIKRSRHFVFDLLPGDHPVVKMISRLGVVTLALVYAWVGTRVALLNYVVYSQPSEIPLTYFMAAIPASGILTLFFLVADAARDPWWRRSGEAAS